MKNKKTTFRWILPLFLAITLCIMMQDMTAFATEVEETGETTSCNNEDWELKIYTPATCQQPGEYVFICKNCGEIYREEIPQSSEHSWVWKSTTPATCDEPGEYVYTCGYCDEIHIVKIPKQELWIYNRTIKYATCNSTGLKEYKCYNCGETKTEVIPIDTNAHKWKSEVTKKPTLTEKGTYTTSCEVCGKQQETSNLLLAKITPFMNCAKYAEVYSTTSPKNAYYIAQIKRNTEVYAFEKQIVDNNFTFLRICYPVGSTETAYVLSSYVSILTDEKQAPGKITSVKLSTGKKKMTVSWKKDDIATGYQITYATNKQLTKGKHNININNNKTVKRTIKKLKSKTWYYVGVRGYRKVNGTKIYGPYSLVRLGRVK